MEPSAEELLFLVMRRTRCQQEFEEHSLLLQQELHAQNQALQNDVRERQTALDDSLLKEQEQTEALTSCQAKLKDYTNRFNLLKDWCKGMSRDLKQLKDGANKIRMDQEATNCARESIKSEMTVLRSSSDNTANELSNFKTVLASTTSKLQPLERDFKKATEQLRLKNIRISDLETSNTKLQDRVAVLQNEQSANQGIERQQIQWFEKFKKLQIGLQSISPDLNAFSAQSPIIAECLELLKALSSRNHVQPGDLHHLQETVTCLKEKFEKCTDVTVDTLQQATSFSKTIAGDIAADVATNLESTLSKLNTCEKIDAVKDQNDGFHKTLEQTGKDLTKIQQQISSAEDRGTESISRLAEILKTLERSLAARVIPMEEHARQLLEKESFWTHRICQAQLQRREAEVRVANTQEALRAKDRAYRTLQSASNHAQSSLSQVESRLRASEESSHKKTQELTSLRNKLTEKEAKLKNIEARLIATEQSRSEFAQQLGAAARSLKQQDAELETAKRQAQRATETSQGSLRELEHLRQQLLQHPELERRAEELAAVQQQLQIEQRTVRDLDARTKTLDGVSAENANLVQKCQAASDRVTAMEYAVGSYTKLREDHLETQTSLKNAQEQCSRLQAKLAEAQQQANMVPGLEQQLKKQVISLHTVEEKLKSVQALPEQLKTLEAEKLSKTSELEQTRLELQAARVAVSDVATMKETLKDQDVQLSGLKQRLEGVKDLTAECSQLREACEQKGAYVNALLVKIHSLEQASLEIPEPNHDPDLENPEPDVSQYSLLPSQETENSGTRDQRVTRNGSKREVPSIDRVQRRRADRRPSPPLSREMSRNAESLGGRVDDKTHGSLGQILLQRTHPESTGDTTFVPESQIGSPLSTSNFVVRDNLEEQDLGRCTSPLTELEDISDFDALSNHDLNGACGSEKPDEAKDTATESEQQQAVTELGSSYNSGRMSSSSQSEQMLLETLDELQPRQRRQPKTAKLLQGEHGGIDEAPLSSGLPDQLSASTTTNKSATMPWNNFALPSRRGDNLQQASSKTIQPQQIQSTSERGPSDYSRIRESTPGATREKPQPNSAAKRRHEEDGTDTHGLASSRRLKRTPALKVQKTSSAQDLTDEIQDDGDQALVGSRTRLPNGSRQGSVIGTNAPNPGKIQRSKPTRKGSKRDRYSARFQTTK